MVDFINVLNQQILPHWPFVAVMLMLMSLMQVIKTGIFTVDALKRKPEWFWYWGRITLPIQPIVMGLLIALFWQQPEPIINTLPERLGYFGLSGSCSVWLYQVLKGLAKRKGIDFDLPGDNQDDN